MQLRDAVLDDGSFRSWDTPPLDGRRQRGVPARAGRRVGRDRPGRIRGHRRGHGLRPARRAWWPASSTSWPARSGWPPPSGSPRPCSGRPPSDCRCWPRRVRAAPACRRAPSRSCRWSRSRRPSSCTSGRICLISCTCAIRPRAGCSRRGARSGHVTAAEPGALVGFLGPRVYEHLYGEPFPAGIQTAENLHRHGVIDGVVPLGAAALARWTARSRWSPTRPSRRRPPPRPSRCPTCPRGSRSRRRGARTGPASDICCGTAPPSGCCCPAPSGARRRPRCWRWPGSAASLRWCWASNAWSAA